MGYTREEADKGGDTPFFKDEERVRAFLKGRLFALMANEIDDASVQEQLLMEGFRGIAQMTLAELAQALEERVEDLDTLRAYEGFDDLSQADQQAVIAWVLGDEVAEEAEL